MEKTVKVLEDHKNLIQSAAGSIASMGLDHVGKKVGGVLVTPAVWVLNHSTTGAEPDKTDVGIYATGFLSAGASVAVGLLKAHVDDDMNKKLTEIQRKENAKWSPYIKNCYHFSSSAPAISAKLSRAMAELHGSILMGCGCISPTLVVVWSKTSSRMSMS